MADKLYVWANPLQHLKRFDHTWVTSYDAPFSCTKDGPPQHYWYCWGECHAVGPKTTPRLLGKAPADLGIARCLCQPDDPISRPGRKSVGGVNFYGVQGVCHQLANRVLFATTTTPPLTVLGAHGFDDSRNLYGTYGKNVREWRNRVKRCTGRDIAFPTVSEEFMTRLRHELPHLSQATRDELQRVHGQLLQHHEELSLEVLAGALNARTFADQTNDTYREARQAWASTVNAEDFLFYFQTTPGELITIIDPDVAARIDYIPRKAEPSQTRTVVIRATKHYAVKTPAQAIKYAAKKTAKAVQASQVRKGVIHKRAVHLRKAARAAGKSGTTKGR